MQLKHSHTDRVLLSLGLISAILFGLLFGQGLHLHEFSFHGSDPLNMHVHVHAHHNDSEPANQKDESDEHQHDVNTTTDIIGTLTAPYRIKPEVKTIAILSLDLVEQSLSPFIDDASTICDLPPPKWTSCQYHHSFSYRGPPLS